MVRFKREMMLRLLAERKLTIKGVARMAGVSPHTVRKAVFGKPIMLDCFMLIAGALEIDPNEYMED